jgi:RimJ/RimL family protein N-acetyltransferase
MLYKDFDLIIKGPRITIEPLQESDNDAYCHLLFGELYEIYKRNFPDERINAALRGAIDGTSNDETHAIRIDGRFIGWYTLQKDSEGRPDLGISLIPEERCKGFAKEATKLFTDQLYRKYGLQRVYARAYSSNTHSQHVLVKMGAVLDSVGPDERIVELRQEIEKEGEAPLVHYYHLDLPLPG